MGLNELLNNKMRLIICLWGFSDVYSFALSYRNIVNGGGGGNIVKPYLNFAGGHYMPDFKLGLEVVVSNLSYP